MRQATDLAWFSCADRATRSAPNNPSTLLRYVEALFLFIAYLFGSIPAGVLISRLYRLDIRQVGSGNIGATNVQRALGWGPGLFVLFFDALKGAGVVWAVRSLGLSDPWVTACGFSTVLGHNYSVFLGFKGGKGVATSLGTVTCIAPDVGLFSFLVAVTNISLTRYVSAGSLLGALSATFYAFFSPHRPDIQISCTAVTLLMFWTHRDNLARLQKGVERRFGEKIPAVPATDSAKKEPT